MSLRAGGGYDLHNYDSLLFGEIVNRESDLYAFWHSSQRKDPGLNVAMYTNAKVDKILEDASITNDEQQRDLYSGKKKRHTVKNTIIATVTKWVLFVGGTFSGHEHDFTMLKNEFPPEHAWFKSIRVLVDLGYQGILDAYEGENIG